MASKITRDIIVFIYLLLELFINPYSGFAQNRNQQAHTKSKAQTQQTRPTKPAVPAAQSAQPTQLPPDKAVESKKSESLFDILPASTVSAALYSDTRLIKLSFDQIFRFTKLDIQQCRMAAGIDIASTNPNDSQAFIIVTPQAETVVRDVLEKELRKTVIEGEKVWVAGNGIVFVAYLGNDRLLIGTKNAFSTVLAAAKGRQPNLSKARPDLKPLIDTSRESPDVRFVLVTQDVLNKLQIIFSVVGNNDIIDAEAKRTLLNLRAVALDTQDGGRCSTIARFQFADTRSSINATFALKIVKFLSNDAKWDNVDISTKQALVSVNLSRVTGDCDRPTISITGQLRIVDPESPSKIWNIDNVPQSNSDNERTVVNVLLKDSPNKVAMVLPVDQNGAFSSKKALKGVESDLVEGKKYILRTSLRYRDNINVGNTLIPFVLGCGSPDSNKVIRTAVREKEITLRKQDSDKPVNIDYPLPVILVHGINACWAGWDIWTSHLLNYQRDKDSRVEGYIVFTPSYDYIGPTITHEKGAIQTHEQLMADLDGLFHIKPKLNLICHSNGGVIARILSYMSFGDYMNRIYTLGTPYTGTMLPGAQLYILSFRQMLSFNRRYPRFGTDVKVVAISGTANDGPIAGILTGFFTGQPNDGIVYPQPLSHMIISFNFDPFSEDPFGLRIPLVFKLNPVPLYHSAPYSPTFLSEEGYSQVFNKFIFPGLGQPPGSSSTNSSTPIPSSNTTEPTSTASNLSISPIPTIFSQEMQVDSRLAQEVDITIPVTEVVSFMSQSISAKTTFTLIDPAGVAIKPTTAKSYPGAKYGLGAFLEETIAIKNPKPGNWKLRVMAIGNSGKTKVMAIVASKWVLVGGTDQENYAPSSKVILGAKLTGDFVGVKVDSITATLRDTEGKEVNKVNLVDKGKNIYESSCNAPSLSQTYNVTFEASGIDKGKPFKQQWISDFNVMGVAKVFTGKFVDKLLDTDGNNKSETIAETINLNFPEVGEYIVEGDLVDSNGVVIYHAMTAFEAKRAGLGELVLNFNVAGLTCTQLSGSLQIKNLKVEMVKKGYIALETWSSPIEIAKYSGKEFGLDCKSAVKPEPNKGIVNPELKPTPMPSTGKLNPEVPRTSNLSFNGNLRTDIQVNAGDTVKISASGSVMIIKRPERVYCGPDGIKPTIDQIFGLIVKTANQGALLARINSQGNEKWIVINSGQTFTAPNAGVLELQVNDKKYQDNEGSFDVRIKVDRTR